MRFENLLQPHIPNDKVKPVSHHIPSLSLKFFRLTNLFGYILALSSCHWSTLRPVLLEILGYVVVVKTLADLLETGEDLWDYVYANLRFPLLGVDGHLDVELISEVVELLFLKLLHHIFFGYFLFAFANIFVEKLVDVGFLGQGGLEPGKEGHEVAKTVA